MKLDRIAGNQFVFRFSSRERHLLLDLLARYPLIPPQHSQLTRGSDPRLLEEQRLLDEALAEHRAESRRQLQSLVDGEGRFRQVGHGFEFSLERLQLEWLLQVLNDIKVGSWIQAGSPDTENGKLPELTAENLPHFLTMELAGAFQMLFLKAADTGK